MPPIRRKLSEPFARPSPSLDTDLIMFKTRLDTDLIMFKTRLESLIKHFLPIEKSQTRELVRQDPRCSLCLCKLVGDNWDLVHLCDPVRCVMMLPEPALEDKPHACDPVYAHP